MKSWSFGLLAASGLFIAACGADSSPPHFRRSTPHSPQGKFTPAAAFTPASKLSAFAQIGHGDKKYKSKTAGFVAIVKGWDVGPKVTTASTGDNSVSIEVVGPDGKAPDSIKVGKITPQRQLDGGKVAGVPQAFEPQFKVEKNILKVTKLGLDAKGDWVLVVKATVNGKEDSIEIPVHVDR